MSKIKNTPHITDDSVVNVRRAAIEQRGRWAAAFYQEAKEEGIDLEPIMRKAIRKIGVKSGEKEKKSFEGKDLNAETYAKYFTGKALSETFEKKLVSSNEDEAVVTLNYCALLKAWQEMGLSDEECAMMCSIAMEGDRGIAEGVGLDFELEGSLADGCEYCTLRYKTKK
ncbi:MAG: L-2-amino-thiazoline-4-carboxylic acid hydrolase [Erysipelotrichaceae bacterium]|nr:L-2-amino-thiazoline-4-carboxylic acid hydrolase [Erysipelotrichaceae bacterium]